MVQSVARSVVQATALQDTANNPEVVMMEPSTFATVAAGGGGRRGGRPVGHRGRGQKGQEVMWGHKLTSRISLTLAL